MNISKYWKIILFSFFIQSLNAQTVTQVGNLNTCRSEHESAVLPDGRILVMGGHNSQTEPSRTVYKTCEIFDPSSNSWTYGPSMYYQRTNFCSVTLHDGRIMVIGGESITYLAISDCEVYNPATSTWSNVASIPVEKAGCEAVVLQNGDVLVTGGFPSSFESYIYNPQSNTWKTGASLIYSRSSGITLTLLESGKVLLVGGEYETAFIAEIYDPVLDVWEEIPNKLIYRRNDHSSVLMNDGKVIIIGTRLDNLDSKKVEIFDPSNNSFTETTELNFGRQMSEAILTDNGKILIYGPGDIFNTDKKNIEIYDPITKKWSSINLNSASPYDYSINKLNNGKILIAGGNLGNICATGTLLVSDDALTDCSYTSINASLSETNICYGKNVELTITNPQTDVEYTVFIGNSYKGKIGKNVTNPILTIPFKQMSSGKNAISIFAKKDGCYSNMVNNLLSVNNSITFTDTTKIVNKKINFCKGTSLQLKAANSSYSYIWNTNETTQNITITKEGNYFVQLRNTDGCLGIPSPTVFADQLEPSSTVNAGQNFNICFNEDPLLLGGNPAGGIWKGNGVIDSSFFNPNLITTSSSELTYDYCGVSDKIIVSLDTPITTLNSVISFEKHVRYGSGLNIDITNADSLSVFTILINNTNKVILTGNTEHHKNISNAIYSDSKIQIQEKILNSCGELTKTINDTVFVHQAPNNVTLYKDSDYYCPYSNARIYVSNPQKNIRYYLKSTSDKTITDTILTNGLEPVFFDIPVGYTSKYIAYVFQLYMIDEYGFEWTYFNKISFSTYKRIINFDLSRQASLINTEISVTKQAFQNTYWYIDPRLIITDTTLNSFTIKSPTTGKFEISLFQKTDKGCLDSVKKIVTFFNDYKTNLNLPLCSYGIIQNKNGFQPNKFEIGNNVIHVDSHNNSYIYYWDNNNLIYTINSKKYRLYDDILIKTNKDGRITHKKNVILNSFYNRDYFNYKYCNGISSDQNENIYIIGVGKNQDLFFEENCPLEYFTNYGYIAKLDSTLSLEWKISLDKNPTDIKYINNDSIWVYIYSQQNKIEFYSKNITKSLDIIIPANSLILIDSSGTIKSIIPIPNSFLEVPYYHPESQYTTNISPVINVVKDRIEIFGMSSQDNITINSKIEYDITNKSFSNLKVLPFKAYSKIYNSNDQINFNSNDLIYKHSKEYYIFKYDSITTNNFFLSNNILYASSNNDNLLWSIDFKKMNAQAVSFCVHNGNSYIIGNFFNNINFEEHSNGIFGKIEDCPATSFLMKINASGMIEGMDVFGSCGNDSVFDITLTKNHQFKITGYAMGYLHYNGKKILETCYDYYTLTLALNNCSFVDKPVSYLPVEDTLFDYKIKNLSYIDITHDYDDNLYCLGNFKDSVEIDGKKFSSINYNTNNINMLVYKIDSTGNLKWANTISINMYESSSPELRYSNNKLYLIGNCKDSISINGINRTLNKKYFIVSMDYHTGKILEIRTLDTLRYFDNYMCSYLDTSYNKIIKFNASEQKMWEINYKYLSFSFESDSLLNTYCIARCYSEECIFGDRILSGKFGNYLIKIDKNGVIEWINNINTYPFDNSYYYSYKFSEKLELDRYGNLYALCVNSINQLTSKGEILWSKKFPVLLSSFTIDNNHNFYISSGDYSYSQTSIDYKYYQNSSMGFIFKLRRNLPDCSISTFTKKNLIELSDTLVCPYSKLNFSFNKDYRYSIEYNRNITSYDYGSITIQLDSIDTYLNLSIQDENTGCYTGKDTVVLNVYPYNELKLDTVNKIFDYETADTLIDVTSSQYVSYNWSPKAWFSDATISNPFVRIIRDSPVILTVEDVYGCEYTATLNLKKVKYTNTNTNINEIDESSFNMYPNPVSDILYLDLPFGCSDLRIYTDTGQLLYEASVLDNLKEIDFSKFVSGAYVLKFLYNDKLISRTILVK